MIKRLLLAALGAALTGGVMRASANTADDALKGACKQLLTAPLDADAVRELSAYACATTSLPQLKSKAMAVVSLVALANADSNLFIRARSVHAARFPSDQALIRVSLRDCFLTCAECAGQGFRDTPYNCEFCSGSGTCPSKDCDKGKWIVSQHGHGGPKRLTSVLDCPKCKGTGLCPKCNRLTTVRTQCAACSGKGSYFRRPPALFENYEALLRGMLSQLDEEEAFEGKLQQAQAETNLEQRVSLCQKMLADFRSHRKIDEVASLLASAQKVRADAESERIAVAKKKENELAELAKLQSAKNVKASIVTLQNYLETHQLDTADKLKVEALLHERIATLDRQRKHEKLAYMVGGLLVVLFGVSCINIHTYKYTLLPSYSPRGGAAKRSTPGGTPLTDPLSLTAKASRSRVKTKTAQIQEPDE